LSQSEIFGAPNTIHAAPVTWHVTFPVSHVFPVIVSWLVIGPLKGPKNPANAAAEEKRPTKPPRLTQR
jgi:hypothetical protein